MAGNFCFNFEICNDDRDSMDDSSLPKQQKQDEDQIHKPTNKAAELIIPSEDQLNKVFDDNIVTQLIELPGLNNESRIDLRYLSVKYVENLVRNSREFSSSGTNQALNMKTDLIPSLYEGGMKVWECSVDLVEFLHHTIAEEQLQIAGKKVLELGCGAGLPGIYCLINGASVHFQDYNSEVLKLFTIPNVALNSISQNSPVSKKHALPEIIQNSCQFFSGDWSVAYSVVQKWSYDIILTSETIYNVDMQHSLYELIKYSLKPGGVAFVAAKSYYFGVGGGTEQFVQFVHKDGVFDISTVKIHNDGVKREILKMEIVSE